MKIMTPVQGVSSTGAYGAPIRRVLVLIDFGPSTVEILHRAKALSEELSAAIHFLHVIPPKSIGDTGSAHDSLVFSMGEAAHQELTKLLDITWPGQIPAAIMIREGPLQETILQEARTLDAQLIMVGIHSMKGVSRWRNRSSMDQVLHGAPCPVMVVREQAMS